MHIFLTSSMGGNYEVDGVKMPCAFDNANHFVDRLRTACGTSPRVMAISSMPDGHEINDMYHRIYDGAFEASGFAVPELVYVDDRNPEQLERIDEFDLIILCGGHVPTQNNYFRKIGLRDKLASWDGTIVGISAGSMNAAETVYAQPEIEGEAADPMFKRYFPGLGLTNINVLPHFSEVRHLTVDGYQVERDLTRSDSYNRPILALNDGSYVHIIRHKKTTASTDSCDSSYVYGNAWLFNRGRRYRYCINGLRRRI